MSVFVFKRGPSGNLNNLPIEDGSIIFTKDTKQLFIDIDTNRYPVSQEMATDDDIVNMFNRGTTEETSDETNTITVEGSDDIVVTEF